MLQRDIGMSVQVGQDLEEVYWRPGNGAAFLDLVQQLTGEALTADAWVSKLKESVSSVVQQEEQEYQKAVQKGPKIKPGDDHQICHPAQSCLHVQQGYGVHQHIYIPVRHRPWAAGFATCMCKSFDKKIYMKLKSDVVDSHWFLLWLTFKRMLIG